MWYWDRVLTDENGEEPDFDGLSWSHLGNQNWIGFRPSTNHAIIGDWVLTREMRDAEGNGWDVIRSFSVVRQSTNLAGDLSHDSLLDHHDLNILNQNVAVGATHQSLDLNDDDSVNIADVHWRLCAGLLIWKVRNGSLERRGLECRRTI